jgi:vacuolar-type H+-ATPase subunit H
LSLDDIKIECDKIVSKARAEADKKIKDSEEKAAEIGINADKKVKEITELVVNIVTGRS